MAITGQVAKNQKRPKILRGQTCPKRAKNGHISPHVANFLPTWGPPSFVEQKPPWSQINIGFFGNRPLEQENNISCWTRGGGQKWNTKNIWQSSQPAWGFSYFLDAGMNIFEACMNNSFGMDVCTHVWVGGGFWTDGPTDGWICVIPFAHSQRTAVFLIVCTPAEIGGPSARAPLGRCARRRLEEERERGLRYLEREFHRGRPDDGSLDDGAAAGGPASGAAR